MEVKPGYKQTEVGVIPDEWEALQARDIGAFKGGSGFPLTAQGMTTGAYPFFKVSDMNNEGNETYLTTANHYISEATRKRLGATAFPRNAIVIAKVGAAVFLERKKILGQPSCIDNNMAAFILDETRADVQYVHSLLLSKKLGALVATTALPALNGKQLGEMVLAVPPLPEQRAIAAALSDVDALLGRLDRLIAKKRDLKQAAMQQLLTGKTRLPGFSGAWEVRRLGEIADVLRGSALSKSLIAASGAHPCILYGELFTTYGRVISTVISRTHSSEGCRSVAGDVLLPGSTTTTGADLATASALLIEDVALGGDIIIVRRKGKSYDPVFLASFLTHAARKEIAELTQGITIHHLYGKDLKTLSVKLPSLPEQTAIAAVLSDMDTELATLEARRNKTRDLKQAMMQELLTGKTRLVKPAAAHA